jgi:predicted SAM-dependent methyltransferase
MEKLHLGCFDQPIDGWLNTDITPMILVTRVPGMALLLRKVGAISESIYQQHLAGSFKHVRYLDIRRRFRYPDDRFACAYSSHVLEHLYPHDMRHCLAEVFRTLRPGGIFRIAVPDLDALVHNYDSQHPDDFCLAIYESDQKLDKNKHHWMYNEVSLRIAFSNAGFVNIRRCEYRKGGCPDVERIDNRPDSLFMEGEKPDQ